MAPQTTKRQLGKGIAKRTLAEKAVIKEIETARRERQMSRINERDAAEDFIARARAEAHNHQLEKVTP